jgi:MYXO-CTERM domain-containing protein
MTYDRCVIYITKKFRRVVFSCSRRVVNGVAQKGREAVPEGAGYGALMKPFDAVAGGRRSLPSWASQLASTTALAALALIAAPGAKADVVETFNLSGNFSSFFGPLVPFTGTFNLDFSNDFSVETLTSVEITVPGRAVFNQSVSLSVTPSAGIIGAANSAGDSLALWFGAPQSGTWAGFNTGEVSFGDVIFGGLTGLLLGATGEITRDLSDPVILDPPPPPIIDPPPPPIIDPPPPTAVPELSTWAMMLLGLAGLGLVAKRRRAGGKA